MTDELFKKYKRTKYLKLIAALSIDLVGVASYFIPVLGESVDFAWGPISGILIFLLFPNRKIMAISGAIEELLPITDIVPTACIAWGSIYLGNKEKV